jgi:hypothetical protein
MAGVCREEVELLNFRRLSKTYPMSDALQEALYLDHVRKAM